MIKKFLVAIGIIVILLLAISYFVGVPAFKNFLENQQSETAQQVLNSITEGVRQNGYIVVMTDEGPIVLTRDQEKEQEIVFKLSQSNQMK